VHDDTQSQTGAVEGGPGEHLWFLEQLDRLQQVIRGTSEPESVMRAVLTCVLDIYACDRAWLIFPCDPASAYFRVPVRVTRMAGVARESSAETVPMNADLAGLARELLEADVPIACGPGGRFPVPAGVADGLEVRALVAMALHPTGSPPWIFGLDQCASPRTWRPRELRLFQEIGWRLAGYLGTYTILRQLRESEERARLALEVANIGSWWHDLEADVAYLDSRTQELYGLHRDTCCMADLLRLVHPDDAEALQGSIRSAHDPEGTGAYAVEHRIVLPNGEIRWVSKRARTHFTGEGASRRAQKVIGTTHDITQRKQAEESLRASEQRFRAIVDHAADAFFLHGEHLSIVDVNQQACDALGYTREELIGMDPLAFDTDFTPDGVALVESRLASGETLAFETSHRRKDGTVFPVEVRARGFYAEGRFSAVSTAHDISARRKAGESLLLFRSLIDHANDAIEVLDPETLRFLDVNETACRLHGYSREEYLSLTLQDISPDLRDVPSPELLARLLAKRRGPFESRHQRKDGKIFPVEITVNLVEVDRNYLLAVVRDVTERKQAQAALLHSHTLLNAVVEGTGDVIYVKDPEGRYLMINAAGARYFGRSPAEIVGRRDQDLLAHDLAATMAAEDTRVMVTGVATVREETRDSDVGTEYYLTARSPYRDSTGQLLGVVGITRDITHLKRLEEQFQQAQKMEAVGRLAGGIAHDFNNLLTVISGNSQLASAVLPPDTRAREFIEQVLEASERAAALTRQLLAFSRKQLLEPQVVSLDELLGSLLALLRRLIGEDVEITLIAGAPLDLTRVDPGQFEQAVINLVVNARDAMPSGGRILLETRTVELDGQSSGIHVDGLTGAFLEVAVSDTGTGMDEPTLRRIFEPFFTTKPAGKGTGLGLAMVYGFARQSGGHVTATSTPGHGSTFRLYLPRAESGASVTAALPRDFRSPRGTEIILLVEDEAAVRTLARKALQANGYTVLEAADGHEAMALVERQTGPIHLLVTDVVMPGMNGRQLSERLSARLPGLKTLFISGYTDTALDHDDLVAANAGFLQKPFDPIRLSDRVREVLDRPSGRSAPSHVAPDTPEAG
jgi:two-component system cell cycle sensor histidine kinase/response regulator CckA